MSEAEKYNIEPHAWAWMDDADRQAIIEQYEERNK